MAARLRNGKVRRRRRRQLFGRKKAKASKKVRVAKEPSTSEDAEMPEQTEKARARSEGGGQAARAEVNARKKAKLDERRLALRGPHLKDVANVGGIVLTIGDGPFGQVVYY